MAPLSPNGLWYPRSRSNSPTKPSSPHTKNYPTPPSSGSFETFAIRQIIALTALTALTSPSLHHKLGTHHVLLSASAWAGTIVQTVVGWFGLADRSDEMRAHSSVALWLTLTLGVSGLILTRVPSYGKLSDGGSWDIGWLYGPGIPTKMAWVIQETPAFAICGILFLEAIDELGLAQRVVCLMFLLHYFHRSFVYPLQIRGGKPIPILLCICAIAFCSANGYIQGRAITQFTPHLQSASWAFDPRFILGSFVFLLGRNVNLHSDDVLRNLRSSSDSKEYKIPYGGAFKYLSAANMCGEILEWIGFGIACWNSAGLAFVLATVANLGPRAVATDRWYRRKFDEYAGLNRRALIPFVY